jgi:type VI protein secretion system component Hcp
VSDKTAKPEDKKKPEEKELKESQLGQVTGGATDYVLQIEGIKGESSDDKYKDWIE